jgi:propanol-preferring alcohol dehydrogenase
MRAYRLFEAGRAELVELERPRPGPDAVLLRVLAAGVCRSDVTLIRDAGAGAIQLPVTLGHEIAGEVVEAGPGVPGSEVGKRVAVYELRGCGRCSACLAGEDNVCRETSPGAFGVTQDGGMADYVVIPARNLVDLDGLDPVQAAPMTDAGLTALHAIERGRPLLTPEAVALVVGIGGLGHLALQFLAATSEAAAIAVDADRARLGLSRELGARHAVQSGNGAIERVLDANGGRKVDVVFDFVGTQETLDLAARAVRRGGGIVIVGGGGGSLCLTARMGTAGIPEREVSVVHTFGGTRRDLERALALLAEGRVESRTEHFALEEAAVAVDRLRTGGVVGRAVLLP